MYAAISPKCLKIMMSNVSPTPGIRAGKRVLSAVATATPQPAKKKNKKKG